MARILWIGRRVNRALSSDSLKIYTGVASILIESALPFSILGIVYGVYVGNGKAPQVALGSIWGSFVVSPVAVQRSQIKISIICRIAGAISSAHHFEGGDGPSLVQYNRRHTHYANGGRFEYWEEFPGKNTIEIWVESEAIEDSLWISWGIEQHPSDFRKCVHW